jgi:hypothetical protein
MIGLLILYLGEKQNVRKAEGGGEEKGSKLTGEV